MKEGFRMRAESSIPSLTPAITNGVLVLDGYGLQVTVKRRHLLVSYGTGRNRRWARISRATAGIKRLVVLGHSGIVSLDALRWLHDIGASFIQIDRDTEVIAAYGPTGADDARVRRAQALASYSPAGVEIARYLIREKLRGELAILNSLPVADKARDEVESALDRLEKSPNLDEIRVIEGQAALAYWSAWANVPIVFARNDASRIPDHWQTFGQRGSLLTGSPRLATNPINAIFNLLYAVLEAETRIAILAVGLDPGMGILHADQWARDSMALDIMEAVRDEVDGLVLELLRARCFRAADFFETARGQCRVIPPLTRSLAETSQVLQKRVAPVVETVAKILASSNPQIDRIGTPLTQTNRSIGRASSRRLPASAKLSSPRPTFGKTCRICGGDLPSRSRSYCSKCVKQFEKEKLPKLLAAGAFAIARRAAEGRDTAHGGVAARKRGQANSKRMRETQEWDRIHRDRPGPEIFKRDILPGLKGIPLRQIMKASGLSLRYCALIRMGAYVPHPRHWNSLKMVSRNPS
jgi:CRISPR-associated endonuclease Cas1